MIDPSSSASEVETESGAASGADPCCAFGIFWCPVVGEFECMIHGGHDTCCDRPEHHTSLMEFEVQAKALLKWWKEERGDIADLVAAGDEGRDGRVRDGGVPGPTGGTGTPPPVHAPADQPPVGDAGRQGGWELVAYWRPRAQAPDPRRVRAGRFADLPRKVAHREQQVGQQYRSNACIHERHDECDGECVYCRDGCACACHPWNEKVDADEFRRRYLSDEDSTGEAGMGTTSQTPVDGGAGAANTGAPNSWSEFMSTVSYCPGCGGVGCDECGGSGEDCYGRDEYLTDDEVRDRYPVNPEGPDGG